MSDQNLAAFHSRQPDRWTACWRQIEYARLRCLRTTALLEELRAFSRGGVRTAVVDQLIERRLSAAQTRLLAEVLFSLLGSDAEIGQRPKFDRAFGRLAEKLRATDARRLVVEMIKDRRQRRRDAAYRFMRRAGLPRGLVPVFQRAWKDWGDEECLRLLTSTPGGFRGLDIEEVMSAIGDESQFGIEDSYWESRAIERFVADREVSAERFFDRWPMPLARAIGRLANRRLAPLVVQVALKERTVDAMSLAASVLGRLRAREAVELIDQLATEVMKEHGVDLVGERRRSRAV